MDGSAALGPGNQTKDPEVHYVLGVAIYWGQLQDLCKAVISPATSSSFPSIASNLQIQKVNLRSCDATEQSSMSI